MVILTELVSSLINQPTESEWLEFKENFHSSKELGERISALANGACICNQPFGYLLYGITDQTHQVVGTTFVPQTTKGQGNEDLEHWLTTRLRPKNNFKFETLNYKGKRLILVCIPAASGSPVSFHEETYIRVGSYTKKLKDYPEKEKKIWENGESDWSANICHTATIDDLNPIAIEFAKEEYKRKHPHLSTDISQWDNQKFLDKAKITIQGKITNTAIILLGKTESTHFLSPAIAHITWILKGTDNIEKDYQHFSPPFLLTINDVYNKIRNLKYRYILDGTLFPEEVDQYDPYIIREALNNAIAHQDYRLGGRVTIVEKEDSTLSFQNYGSFLPISIENVILEDIPQQKYRNKFLVDAMVNLNLIDTIGSGIRKMFLTQKQKFFPMPDYSFKGNKVHVKFTGKVLNIDYAKKLATLPELSLTNIIALDQVQKKLPISDKEAKELKSKHLIEGRKPNYYISASLAERTNQRATYMEMRGLEDTHYQELIIQYLQQFEKAKKIDLENMLIPKLPQILTHVKKVNKIRNLLQKMRRNSLIQSNGKIWTLPNKE